MTEEPLDTRLRDGDDLTSRIEAADCIKDLKWRLETREREIRFLKQDLKNAEMKYASLDSNSFNPHG